MSCGRHTPPMRNPPLKTAELITATPCRPSFWSSLLATSPTSSLLERGDNTLTTQVQLGWCGVVRELGYLTLPVFEGYNDGNAKQSSQVLGMAGRLDGRAARSSAA